jgi:hypothetical protein
LKWNKCGCLFGSKHLSYWNFHSWRIIQNYSVWKHVRCQRFVLQVIFVNREIRR